MFLRWDSYYVKFVSSKIFFFVPIKCNLFWFITLQPDNELCYIRNFYPLERATFGKESKQIKLLTAATFFIQNNNFSQFFIWDTGEFFYFVEKWCSVLKIFKFLYF